MAKILHIIQQVSRGGATRATLYLAKYSRQFGGHEHKILSLLNPDPDAVKIADENGVQTLFGLSHEQICQSITDADIVQVSWWNNAEVMNLLRSRLPESRFIGWFHVGGSASPQIVTKKLVNHFDYAIACSPHTYQCEAIQELSDQERIERTALVYGATDFERLKGMKHQPHAGYTIGYIGTLDFIKMHRSFVKMSANVSVPDARFIICGSGGGAVEEMIQEAKNLGVSHKFIFPGYIEDIRSVLSTLDIYGYPLCAETYAASEMNLQEVMFAGIPSVVFPYGGIQDLVIHNHTGLIVESESDYTQAIEYLCNNPDERVRLGANAKRYAQNIFGADNAGREINRVYERLLLKPKSEHVWPGDPNPPGAEAFIETLGRHGEMFEESLRSTDPQRQLEVDERIMKSSIVLRNAGITPYKNAYPNDIFLKYWDGISKIGAGEFLSAALSLVEAVNLASNSWRVFWFLGYAAKKIGREDLASQADGAADQLLAMAFPQKKDALIKKLKTLCPD